MAAKKIVEDGHTVISPGTMEENMTPLDEMMESKDSPYQEGVAPLAKEDSPGVAEPEIAESEDRDSDSSNRVESESVTVILEKASSYRFRDKVFLKDKPEIVDLDIGEKLLKTGFFKRG